MTVTGHQKSRRGSSGELTYGGYPEFEIHYDVFASSADDQWPTISAYCEANIIARGTPYPTGGFGANDPAQAAICRAITGEHVPNSCNPWVWRVIFRFGFLEPLNLEAQFALSTVALDQVVVDQATYVSASEGFGTGGITEYETNPPGKVAITNATLRESYQDPPPSRTLYGERLRITLTMGSYNHITQRGYTDTLNDRAIQILTQDFAANYSRWTLKLIAVNTQMRIVEVSQTTGVSAKRVYDTTWEFEYSPQSHIKVLQNKGRYHLDLSLPAGDQYLEWTDSRGRRVSKDMPLTSTGDKLLDSNGDPETADQWKTVSWRIEDERDFKTIPGVGSLFTDVAP